MHSQPNCAAFDPLTIDELPVLRHPSVLSGIRDNREAAGQFNAVEEHVNNNL